MPTSYTSLLGFALPVTGELSGTWGDTVNDYITKYVDSAVAGTQTISGSQTAVTLTVTNGTTLTQVGSGSSGSAQYAVINCTGNPAGLLTITAPASSRNYLIINATSTSQSVKIVGAGPTTGVTLVSGESAIVAWNGSDYAKVASSTADGVTTISFGTTGLTPSTATSGAVTVAGTLATANGGTNSTATPTAGAVAYGTGTAYAFTTAGSAGQVLTSNGSSAPTWAAAAVGDVTAAGNNAFTGANTFYNTTGQTFGTGTTSNDGIIVAGRTGGSSSFRVTLTPGTLTASRTATLPDATTTLAGLSVTQAFTATQTFTGSSSALAMVLNDAAEVVTVSATAATGTINYDVTTQAVLFYTTNASGNFTVNIRASSGTSLNTALSTGQSVTVAFLVTNGATAYFNSSVQVDGTTSGVTTRWQGGTAPAAGNASSVDAYVYTIIKTANATFSVFASQTRFA
jgi:hypothetical protein